MHPLHLPTTCRNDLGVSIAGAPRVQVKMYSCISWEAFLFDSRGPFGGKVKEGKDLMRSIAATTKSNGECPHGA